jgi:hypothetical protein
MTMTEIHNKGAWRDRLGYFWVYYKILVILIVIGLIMVINFLHASLTEQPSVLNVMMLDIHAKVTSEKLQQEFIHAASINEKKEKVTISVDQLLGDGSSSYQMGILAKLYSEIGMNQLDVVSMRKDDFANYVKSDMFLDLREVFTPEELSEFTGLYRDDSGRVLGIRCNSMPGIKNISGYEMDFGVMGIVYNTQHKDMAVKYLKYLNGSR